MKDYFSGGRQRIGSILTLCLFTVLLAGCDPVGQKLGVYLGLDSEIAVIFNPCKEGQKVKQIRYLEVVGQVLGDSNDRVLWEIQALEPTLVREFTVGQVPPGFTQTEALTPPGDPKHSLGIQVFQTQGRDYESVGFRLSNLRPDRVYVSGRFLTQEDYVRLDTCNK